MHQCFGALQEGGLPNDQPEVMVLWWLNYLTCCHKKDLTICVLRCSSAARYLSARGVRVTANGIEACNQR